MASGGRLQFSLFAIRNQRGCPNRHPIRLEVKLGYIECILFMHMKNPSSWRPLALAALFFIGCYGVAQELEQIPVPLPPVRPIVRPAPAPRPFAGALPGRPADVLTARFQATILEVEAGADRLPQIENLARSKRVLSAQELQRTLSNQGPTRVLYSFDQPVNVYSESIHLGSSEPVVINSRMTDPGRAINSIQYQDVGIIIRLSAQSPPRDAERKGPDVTLAIELSALALSHVEIAPGRKAVATRKMSLDHTETLALGQPRTMLLVHSASTDPQTPPTTYVVWYLFAQPATP